MSKQHNPHIDTPVVQFNRVLGEKNLILEEICWTLLLLRFQNIKIVSAFANLGDQSLLTSIFRELKFGLRKLITLKEDFTKLVTYFNI